MGSLSPPLRFATFVQFVRVLHFCRCPFPLYFILYTKCGQFTVYYIHIKIIIISNNKMIPSRFTLNSQKTSQQKSTEVIQSSLQCIKPSFGGIPLIFSNTIFIYFRIMQASLNSRAISTTPTRLHTISKHLFVRRSYYALAHTTACSNWMNGSIFQCALATSIMRV